MSNNIFKSCYKCGDRQVGCHANCEKYQAECKQNEEHKKTVRQNREVFNFNYKWKHTR